MKKLICVLGLASLLTVGVNNTASAQFGSGEFGGGRQVSARAKGAIIGAGLGAAAGAIIHRRDPVAGGIVGAVVGGGAGYAVGNNEDKIRERRNHRYYRNNGYQQRNYYRGNGYHQQQRRVYNNGYRY
ncbi:MAG TPA: hypothetical protein PL009_01580 [Flavipsychrobacter sp.]|nr:hypothetical protein [Flavipsychrobacter sp.]